jgi:hypothetical protein
VQRRQITHVVPQRRLGVGAAIQVIEQEPGQFGPRRLA